MDEGSGSSPPCLRGRRCTAASNGPELPTTHGRGGEAQYLSGFAPDREARSQPGVTVAGGPWGVELGMGGPHSFAACRDEKLMHVSDVKAFDEERTWVNRVTCEIVVQPVTDAP